MQSELNKIYRRELETNLIKLREFHEKIISISLKSIHDIRHIEAKHTSEKDSNTLVIYLMLSSSSLVVTNSLLSSADEWESSDWQDCLS